MISATDALDAMHIIGRLRKARNQSHYLSLSTGIQIKSGKAFYDGDGCTMFGGADLGVMLIDERLRAILQIHIGGIIAKLEGELRRLGVDPSTVPAGTLDRRILSDLDADEAPKRDPIKEAFDRAFDSTALTTHES